LRINCSVVLNRFTYQNVGISKSTVNWLSEALSPASEKKEGCDSENPKTVVEGGDDDRARSG